MADPAERVLGLAAFLAARMPHGCTLDDITACVPGYDGAGPLVPDTPPWETVRKRLQRDLGDLHEHFGIEVAFDPDRAVYVLRPPFFTTEERSSLIAASAAVDVDGIGNGPVLGELGAGVDEHEQRIVLSVPSRVRAVCAAIRERQSIAFSYHGRPRTLDAYAVGRWRDHWYVVGREHEADDLRKYRLDRIEDGAPSIATVPTAAEAGGPAYDIPAGFVARDELALDPNDWGRDPHVVATVRVATDHVHTFQYELGGRIVRRTESACDVAVDVRHYASFRDRVLAFREHAVVVDPPLLVELVRDHLAAVAATAPASGDGS